MRHLASHSDVDGRFRCALCSESFGLEKDFRLHKTRHAPNAPHICRHCTGSFVSGLALRRHASICASLPDRPSATSPTQPLSFIDQSPPHPSSASDTTAGPSAPINGLDLTASGWGDAGGGGHGESMEVGQGGQQPNSSPTNSMELASFPQHPASDSGYSSATSSQPSPTKSAGAPRDSLDEEWEDEDEYGSGETAQFGGSTMLMSRLGRVTTFRRPVKESLTAEFLSPPPPHRRVLGEANGWNLETSNAPVSISYLLPIFLPTSALTCSICGKAVKSLAALQEHQARHREAGED